LLENGLVGYLLISETLRLASTWPTTSTRTCFHTTESST